ncbi:MAG: hypothetical protein KAR42_04175 [candidate division Zixibacteria bacterium]|nr:hypothetical protein [candidate division Zixibacteria bacterium]
MVFATAIAVILVLGLFLRTYDLDLDPPVTIGKSSQDLVTDPAHLVSFAANNAKYGESEPFPFAQWQVFKVSLVSATAYIIFSVSEVSRVTASLAGVIPSFLGLLFFILAIPIGWENKKQAYLAVITAAGFLVLNFVLITYNREPFLESGLIFYFGLFFFLFQKYRFRTSNLIAMGVLTSLACITGKAFGATIAIGLIGAILLQYRADRMAWQKVGIVVLSGIISGIVLILILFGDAAGAYVSYLQEHILSAHSTPFQNMPASEKYFTRFMIFGVTSHIFRDSPFLFFSLYIALASFIVIANKQFNRIIEHKALPFSLFWLFALLAIFMQSLYSPLRYHILLFFPSVLVISQIFTFQDRSKPKVPPKWFFWSSAIFLGLLNWFFINNLVLDFFYIDEFRTVSKTIIKYSFIPGMLLTIILIKGPLPKFIVKNTRVVANMIIALMIISTGFQLYQYASWARNSTYTIKNTTDDIAEIMGPEAVLTGPYAPVLSNINQFKHFIYSFGLEKPDIDIFKEFPITHLAVDTSSKILARINYKHLADLIAVSNYQIRGYDFQVLRIANNKNQQAQDYQPTYFEMANSAIRVQEYDSASALNEKFRINFPGNRSALAQACFIYDKMGKLEKLRDITFRLRDEFIDDKSIQLYCRHLIKKYRLTR